MKFQQNIVSENGFTLWLPPNPQDLVETHVPLPSEIWSASSTKRYPFGTKLSADERVWRYCYSGGVCDHARGAGNYNKHIEGGAISN